MIPVLNIWPRLLIMLPIGFVMFVGFSYVAVNLWCSFLTRDFDEKIAALEEEKDNLQRQIDVLRWRHITQGVPFEYQQEKLVSPRPPSDEIERLQEFIDTWQQAGSAARVRSIKVTEWKSLAGQWEDDRLRGEINLLNALAEEETDATRKDQMKARLAVFQMELLSRETSRKTRTELQDRGAGERSTERGPEAIRRRLQDIHGELQLVEAQKRDYLRGKVRLGWRVRS
jgi:hypothetical protein